MSEEQTVIIEGYGKYFNFTIPLGEYTPIMDDEAKICVLQVGEDIYSPEIFNIGTGVLIMV